MLGPFPPSQIAHRISHFRISSESSCPKWVLKICLVSGLYWSHKSLAPNNQFTGSWELLFLQMPVPLNYISWICLLLVDIVKPQGTFIYRYIFSRFFINASSFFLWDQYWLGREGKRLQLESYLATVGIQVKSAN